MALLEHTDFGVTDKYMSQMMSKIMRIINVTRYRIFIILAFLLAPSHVATALEVVSGHTTQGGMIIIKTDPDATLTVDDQPLMLSAEGLAVLGFHRDDTSAIHLHATYSDGGEAYLAVTPELRQFNEQRIDGLPNNMVTPPQAVLDRIARDRIEVSKARSVSSELTGWQQDFIWPTYGIITGIYGSRRILNGEPRAPHYGIDIAANTGTPVKAPADGVITMVDDLYFTGMTIIMDHGHGISSTFLHLDKVNVQLGETVKQGDNIGSVGSSGRSTGAHLDWRINWFDKRLDPALLAGPMPDR